MVLLTMKHLVQRVFFVLLSFLLVAFGQPAWVSGLGLLAGGIGYALFWSSMLCFPSRKVRVLLSLAWYAAVQGVQLSWMTSMHYMGPFILFVYAGLLIGLGIQFCLLSCCLHPKKSLSFLGCTAIAGLWVLLEWIRIYFLTGFTWNPAGLALVGGCYSIQLAAVLGIYGLSFWVICTNLVALNVFFYKRSRPLLWFTVWAVLFIFPHGFGKIYQTLIELKYRPKQQIMAALVETRLLVEQKWQDPQDPKAFIPPLLQWEMIWNVMRKDTPVDLIVFPEGAFPYSMDAPHFDLTELQMSWDRYFGDEASLRDFPPLQFPYVRSEQWNGKTYRMATNAFLAQSLANHFRASVIIGLHAEDEDELRYNAAFLFTSQSTKIERYDKRVLVPVGEYIPMQSFHWIADIIFQKFGIESSFAAGKFAKVLSTPALPIGVAICLEETYSGLVRELRLQGAELLVGLSNDVWFPSSRLPQQHFDHSRVRAVENGFFYLRSSNMGITGGIDCFGKSLNAPLQSGAGPEILYLSIPLFSYPTLYSFLGDRVMMIVSFSFCCYPLIRKIFSKYRKKCT